MNQPKDDDVSQVMMAVLQSQVQSLTQQVEQLAPENERVRKLLTEFDERHDIDAARIEALTAERDALRERLDQVGHHSLAKLPPDCAPKGVPVLVAGGIAMRKTGGEWFSGMCEPAFSRPLNWQPKWWAPIPQQNDPAQQEGAKG